MGNLLSDYRKPGFVPDPLRALAGARHHRIHGCAARAPHSSTGTVPTWGTSYRTIGNRVLCRIPSARSPAHDTTAYTAVLREHRIARREPFRHGEPPIGLSETGFCAGSPPRARRRTTPPHTRLCCASTA